MAEHTHYDNLKVLRSAPPEVIKAAYKALSQAHHPDRYPESDKEKAHRRFVIIQTAYQVLSDPVKRAAYDKSIAGEASGSRAASSASQTGSTYSKQEVEEWVKEAYRMGQKKAYDSGYANGYHDGDKRGYAVGYEKRALEQLNKGVLGRFFEVFFSALGRPEYILTMCLMIITGFALSYMV